MDIQTNHTVTLLNAKCDVVNKLYNIAKKAEYGDVDVSCCLKEMYAKVKLIDRLDCYCFPSLITTTVDATVLSSQLITATNDYGDGTILSMYVNSVLVSTQVVTAPDLSKQLNVYELISNSGYEFEYHQVTADGSTTFDPLVIGYYIINFPCNANLISGVKQDGKGTPEGNVFNIEVSGGVCEFTYSECYNCVEDSDLPKMYEVLKKLG